ncbi:hypothetical protein HQ865_17670 [Mucilaginibacter mali]|uniref:Addiction module component n=1 Tax=Mucilaginibacter mali TaxID=2740462 RepID=A0A7D4TQN9_9SPHI|nr:hypothetical protein [Mucilaginibacter mali]QKJ31514.1 hypothetical protein HQ865_17670 [Mucilaginibacter mali]
MDTLAIRQELHHYIDTADDASVEAMYSNIKNEAIEKYEWWNDEELMAELDKRSADLESGKDPGMTLEQSIDHLMNRLK